MTKTLFKVFGYTAVGLGLAGAFLPLLPTTPFLLLAVYCFSKSDPRLNEWLQKNRLFGRYIRNYQQGEGFSPEIKAATILMLWGGLSFSAIVFAETAGLKAGLYLIAVFVTWHIVRIRPHAKIDCGPQTESPNKELKEATSSLPKPPRKTQMIPEILDQLRAEDNFRTLTSVRTAGKYLFHDGKRYLNLSSNDYLGVTDEPWYREFMLEAAQSREFLLSNPSSRLITGNSPDYERLESTLSALYGGREALVLGSGYLTNSGILPALTTKQDLILADKLVHASLIDGLRLSEATLQRFAHNDMNHLERLLGKFRSQYRQVWIVTESVFSMDGDIAPLREMAALKQRYDCKMYIDEAHAFGVCGPGGRGIAAETHTDTQCDILIATLGKAIASQGAFVISDAPTRDFLINRMRTLIFSTALPPLSLRWSEEVIRRLPQLENKRLRLRKLSQLLTGNEQSTHIIPLMAGENRRAIEMSQHMREAGFWVTPIRYPTVPKGSARIRISLSAALTPEDIAPLAERWKNAGW